jgi:hypothetical protein
MYAQSQCHLEAQEIAERRRLFRTCDAAVSYFLAEVRLLESDFCIDAKSGRGAVTNSAGFSGI